jgi:hypothetical protein
MSDTKAKNTKVEAKPVIWENRYDYAWKFFDHHAKQRMTMFNFFMIFSGLIFAAYAQLFGKSPPLVSCVLALFGCAVCLSFICLDRRNEEFVHMAEDMLRSVEKNWLCKEWEEKIEWPKRRNFWGSKDIRKEGNEGPHCVGMFMRQDEVDDKPESTPEHGSGPGYGPSKFRHGRWIPLLQAGMAVMCFAGAIVPFYLPHTDKLDKLYDAMLRNWFFQ